MNSTDELISRHLDGANTPEDTGALETLIASDPEAARALVRAARLDVLLQRRRPRKRSLSRARAPLRWTLAAAAAALVTGGVLTVRLLTTTRDATRPELRPEATSVAQEKWVPVEEVPRLPVREINSGARTQWEFWQDVREESLVPLPNPVLRSEIKEDGHLYMEGSAKDYEPEWGLKRREAKIVEMDASGVIDFGHGDKVVLKSFALKVPDIESFGPGANGLAVKPAVFSDVTGRPMKADNSAATQMGGALRFAGTGSRLQLTLQPPPGKEITVLGLDVFQPESGIRLSGSSGGSSLVKGELRTGVEALLTSRAPVIVALELGIATAPPVVLPAKEGAAANAGFAEARIVRIWPGAWAWAGGGVPDKPQDFLGAHFRPAETKAPSDQHCLIGLNLSPGLAVRIAARTADGMRQADMKRDQWDRLVRFASFDVPAASIEALEIQPLARRRVFIRYTPPVDPWQGTYKEEADALDVRIPFVGPGVWPCAVIERLTGSAERELSNMVSGRRIFITSEMRNASIREVLAHYARSSEKGRLEMEPRLRRFRMVPQ